MPDDGMAAAMAILQVLPATKIILMTAPLDENSVVAAVQAGAVGYLPTDVDPRRLSHIVRAVARQPSRSTTRSTAAVPDSRVSPAGA